MMTSNTPLLRFENIDFWYTPDAPVLTDVSFDVHRGEVVTLLGPSGCGKSTLLNMAAGLLFPRRGTCLFDGKEVDGANTQCGYMTQEDTLLPWRSVAKNIGLPLQLQKKRGSTRERNQMIQRYLSMLHLEEAAKLYPAQLSGGMKRRALLARSLISSPEMLLMDEPFGAVDASLRDDLHIEARRVVEVESATVLFVTHDISEAALLSDRVLIFGGTGVTKLTDDIDVPFGRERDLVELRLSEQYLDLQRELRMALDRARSNVTAA